MLKIQLVLFLSSAFALSISAGQSQQTTEEEQPPMSFFVTSVGLGDGANLGGLEGADKHCQALAEAADAKGKT